MTEPPVIDVDATEVTDLVPTEVGQNLFKTDEPAEVLTKAAAVADALAPVIRAKGMVSNIQGKDHVRVEGWVTLGAMLGVTPVTVSTTKLENGWEARVEARTLDGRVIGAADSMCTRDEGRWSSSDDYAIRSMAQTRATSRALASVLRFVVTLAGLSGTPAEEMDGVKGGGSDRPASDRQKKFLNDLFGQKKVPADERIAIVNMMSGGPAGSGLTSTGASEIINALKEGGLEDLRERAGLNGPDPDAQVDDEDLDLGEETL